jgi:hypothetical protein
MTAYGLLAAVLLLLPVVRGSRPATSTTTPATTNEKEHRP